jgi:hypothetical protein
MARAKKTVKRRRKKVAPIPMEAIPRSVVERLTWYFDRNGFVRRLDPERREKLGEEYHKGDEVRLVANSKVELNEIRRLLRAAGFKPGSSFGKDNQFRQPIYGRREVARFLELIGRLEEES